MLRRMLLAAACLAGWEMVPAGAGASAWRDMPLPADSERFVREAEAASEPAAAGRLYAQAIRLCPSNGPALFGLGRVLLDQGRAVEALRVFRRMDELFPDDDAILEALAMSSARLPEARRGDIAAGLAWAERATQVQPDDPGAWHAWSILLHLDGDYLRAAEAARRAVELDAQDPTDPETTARYQLQEAACNDAISVFSPLD